MAVTPCCCLEPKESCRPNLEIADIFRTHGEVYRQLHPLTVEQRRVMRAIETCRTSVLGGYVDTCDQCGHQEQGYNSCRNRHCPKCQSLRQAQWIEQRMQRILPTSYFHVVFTLPHELRPLAQNNPRLIYTLLFATASATLIQLGKDPKRLGALIGVTAVLHTWTRELNFHPHIHAIVTGGGLSEDLRQWVTGKTHYLFPVRVLAQLFRGKFLAGLDNAYRNGELTLEGRCEALKDQDAFNRLKDQLYRKDWVVYAKQPFAGPQHVFNYLGRYTHRVAISNQRLVSIDDQKVCFVTKNGQHFSLSHQEFIRRFLLHVLPTGFVKIRHYGLLAPINVRGRWVLAQRLLSPTTLWIPRALAILLMVACCVVNLVQPQPKRTWVEHFEQLTGINLHRCPKCHTGQMVRRVVLSPWVTHRQEKMWSDTS